MKAAMAVEATDGAARAGVIGKAVSVGTVAGNIRVMSLLDRSVSAANGRSLDAVTTPRNSLTPGAFGKSW